MNRPPAAAAEEAELQAPRGFLRAFKSDLPFIHLAERAVEAGHRVSRRPLRRALDGRLPSRATVIACEPPTGDGTRKPCAGRVQ